MEPERPSDWDALARRMGEPQFEDTLALHKRKENLDLVSAWVPLRVRRLLKTNLFEEVFGKGAILDAHAPGGEQRPTMGDYVRDPEIQPRRPSPTRVRVDYPPRAPCAVFV